MRQGTTAKLNAQIPREAQPAGNSTWRKLGSHGDLHLPLTLYRQAEQRARPKNEFRCLAVPFADANHSVHVGATLPLELDCLVGANLSGPETPQRTLQSEPASSRSQLREPISEASQTHCTGVSLRQ